MTRAQWRELAHLLVATVNPTRQRPAELPLRLQTSLWNATTDRQKYTSRRTPWF